MIDRSAYIHPSSIVEDGATIHANVYIGPFCFIGENVEIGARTVLKSHVVVKGITRIGEDNQIYQFVSLGEINQDLKYSGEPTVVEIGNRNQIRESVTIHRGTSQGGKLTKIGDDNLLMVNVHVAHDCKIENHCILANNATLGGHVSIGEFAILGGMTGIHQFCKIGSHAMIGGCSGVAQDVPPFVVAHGNHATPFGLNIKGLKRRGFDKDSLKAIRGAYKILYRSGKNLEEAKPELEELSKQKKVIKTFLDFLSSSRRGIIR